MMQPSKDRCLEAFFAFAEAEKRSPTGAILLIPFRLPKRGRRIVCMRSLGLSAC